MTQIEPNFLKGIYFDSACDYQENDGSTAGIPTAWLKGSSQNPFKGLRSLILHHEDFGIYEDSDIAAACGIDASWLRADQLDVDINEALPALGKLALVYLASLRTSAVYDWNRFAKKTKKKHTVLGEDPLRAPQAFAWTLKVMAKGAGSNSQKGKSHDN